MDTPTPSAELLRAQAILAAGLSFIELIEADNVARQGIGGPLRATATLHSMATHGLSDYAAAFNLPYGGATDGQPAQPTGGE